jgi:poly(3-hydroxybutyrate) depolymerase
LTGYSAGGRLASAVWLPELFAELIEVAGNVVVRLGVLRILFMLVAVVAVVALVATVATA